MGLLYSDLNKERSGIKTIDPCTQARKTTTVAQGNKKLSEGGKSSRKRNYVSLHIELGERKKSNTNTSALSSSGRYFLESGKSLNKSQERVQSTPQKCSYLAAFFQIYDNDDVIQDFLWMDSCFVLADNYLLSMVYTYFRRANLYRREYTRINFFAALYLAHDTVEDNEDLKLQMYPWVLGVEWKNIKDFIKKKDELLQRMDYRAAVSKRTCDEVMKLFPTHPIWRRRRKPSHGGTVYFESCTSCLEEKPALPSSVSDRSHRDDISISVRSEESCFITKAFSVADVGLSDVLICH